jgi:2-polyprenyl-3-methyl-5-hydroxy-6-metoxy-1,4-benzoquinol methylase
MPIHSPDPLKIHCLDAAVSNPPFPEIADIETASENYANRFAGKIGKWFLQIQAIATLKFLAHYPKATVLDVGGGHGQTLEPLIQQGYQVTILGSAPICRARIQNSLDANLCQFQVGNVLDLPYPDEAFDVVISYRFMAHVEQWQQFVRELSRVAKKAVIIDYPTQRSINALTPYLFKFKKGLEKNTRPFICYQEAELIRHFQNLGLHLDQRYAQFFYPMVVHRALKADRFSAVLENSIRWTGLTRLLGSPVIAKFTKH